MLQHLPAVPETVADEGSEAATRIMVAGADGAATSGQQATADEDAATRLMQRDTAPQMRAADTVPADGLTRVGSILGTPLYMSPEQCQSGPLDARTDIYSLGVITYQMLAGTPPFTGALNEVMRQHIEAAPPPLRTKRKQIRKRLEQVVMSALAKNPAERPATAIGFASALRAQSEGTGALLRRAFALYSEHFPKFFRVAFFAMLPIIIISILDVVNAILMRRGVISPGAGKSLTICATIMTNLGNFVASSIVAGMTIRLVNQLFLAPLRPIELRLAFAALKKRLRKLLLATLMIAAVSFLGLLLFIVPGVIYYINSALTAPVVMMENLGPIAARRRSKELVRRARRTVMGVVAMQYLIPILASSVFATMFSLLAQAAPEQKIMAAKLTTVVTHALSVFFVPLISTLSSLLYLKTRAAGGESLTDALTHIEEEERPRRQWELRIRERMHSSTSASR
jgi:hypothetical protein